MWSFHAAAAIGFAAGLGLCLLARLLTGTDAAAGSGVRLCSSTDRVHLQCTTMPAGTRLEGWAASEGGR
jgi:hypothetical protein